MSFDEEFYFVESLIYPNVWFCLRMMAGKCVKEIRLEVIGDFTKGHVNLTKEERSFWYMYLKPSQNEFESVLNGD